jgi:hypothetical protein
VDALLISGCSIDRRRAGRYFISRADSCAHCAKSAGVTAQWCTFPHPGGCIRGGLAECSFPMQPMTSQGNAREPSRYGGIDCNPRSVQHRRKCPRRLRLSRSRESSGNIPPPTYRGCVFDRFVTDVAEPYQNAGTHVDPNKNPRYSSITILNLGLTIAIWSAETQYECSRTVRSGRK